MGHPGKKALEVAEERTLLTPSDWEMILAYDWKPKYRLVLEYIRENGNKPVPFARLHARSPEFYLGHRDAVNVTLRKNGLPYQIRKIGETTAEAELVVARS